MVPRHPGTALGRIAFRALLAWFFVALGLGATGALEAGPREAPWALVAAAGLPLAAAVILYLRFADVGRFALAIDRRMVTLAQTLRLAGLSLVFVGGGAGLPAVFSAVAAWDALLIGATAPFVAFVVLAHRPAPKGTFALWNVVGLFDLAVLIALTVVTGPSAWGMLAGEATTAAMMALPWSLIPTFLVPLFAILHSIAFVQVLSAGR
jgi:hypothetical protein